MRLLAYLFLAALLAAPARALDAVRILDAGGWFETVWATWSPVAGASSYAVYCTGGTLRDVRLDAPLVRAAGTRMRADAPGLPAGEYALRVVPIVSGTERSDLATTTSSLKARSHVREGFAFAGDTVPGAYQADGSLKPGAKVLYVSASTADSVVLDVVVDGKGKTAATKGLANILAARGKGYDKTPLAVRILGLLKASQVGGLKDGDFLAMEGSNSTDRRISDITIEGVGDDATLHGYGIGMKRALRIEIRNLGIMLFGNDAISLDTDNANVWIHNNDFFYGAPGADADQVKGDGTIDMKYNSSNIAISFNHFFDTGKSMGCGGSTETVPTFFVSFHHNWFDHSDSRNPRLHYATAHVYNNYYDGVPVYGIGNTTETSAFVEANHFRNCPRPMMISGQGTDAWDAAKGTYTLEGTFSGQDGGMTKAWGNRVDGAAKLVYQRDHATQFDAYLVDAPGAAVPASATSVRGAWAYSNFDTAPTMYAYKADPADSVASVVTRWAGRLGGGDFKWEFVDAVDDADHSVNVALKAALVAYGEGVIPVAVAPRRDVAWSSRIVDGILSVDGVAGVLDLAILGTDGGVLLRGAPGARTLDLRGLSRGVHVLRVRTATGSLGKPFIN